MRRRLAYALVVTLGVGLGGLANGLAATASPAKAPIGPPEAANTRPAIDELPNPLEEKRRESRQVALTDVINGERPVERRGPSTVANIRSPESAPSTPSGVSTPDNVVPAGGNVLPPNQYVELQREKTDKIFVILAEFGNQRHPNFPDQDTDPDTPGPTTFDGPLHNKIPQPDRTKDNSTYWQANFDRQHFQDLYFGTGDNAESLKTYYERQSSGRYSVDGQVTDWVKVPYNEARYGRSNGYPCSSNNCSNVWYLIKDALTVWYNDQKAAGRTDEQIKADLASYDQWDRYDYDNDGDFNEPDGYIDHFQIVHAGGDQANNDPSQGEDAIWSHRWYTFYNDIGKQGPAGNQHGGTQIGNTGLWVGDYTMQPENGGLDVFAHEYGHDLGLPDHYDTVNSKPASENPVGWWSIMSQSRVSAPGDNAIDTRAADLSAWDKLQLGWFDYETIKSGTDRTLKLGPHEYNTADAQGAVVVLPKKTTTVALPTPTEGKLQWWSGQGDDLSNTLTRTVSLPTDKASLTFDANWDIEDCGDDPCDYAYVEVDSGSGFKPIHGSITKTSEKDGIDGTSGGWVAATFDLSAYAGKTVGLRLRYTTDGAAGGLGFFVDKLKITTSGGTVVLADGAEQGNNGWTPKGFTTVGSTSVTESDNYYIMSNRQWVSYDQYLKTGPYNFGFGTAKPAWVEHFPYEQGLLISYWDTSFTDNNTSQHHGQGLVLPIDAHPALLERLDRQPWRPRVQAYDAPFSLNKATSMTLHYGEGKSQYVRGQNAEPLFDDSRQYYSEDVEAGVYYGVKVPHNGVKIQVLSQEGNTVQVHIS